MNRAFSDLITLGKLTFTSRKYDPGFVYDQIELKDFLGTEKLFLNLGYWNHHNNYDEACTNLALKLSDWGQLAANQDVLAAGCGLGEECRLWQQQYHLKKIIGINLSNNQLKIAQKRFASDTVHFLKADTTNMGFAGNQFDRVLALESGMHFYPKKHFFQEAKRVLKPGGWVTTADIICLDAPVGFYWRRMINFYARMMQCPKENFCRWTQYESMMQDAGFINIEKIDVSKRVFTGLMGYVKHRTADGSLYVSPALKLLALLNARKGFPFRYVIARGQKPSA